MGLGSGCNSIAGIDEPSDKGASPESGVPSESGGGTGDVSTDGSASIDVSMGDESIGDESIGADASLGDAGGRVDRWVPILGTDDAPSDRQGHSAVWTGKVMIVWGGRYIMTPEMQSGGRYDPATDKWQPTSLVQAPSARTGHTAVWDDAEMIVWGGTGASEGGRYDPVNDRWRPMATGIVAGRSGGRAVWTGREMLVWCGIAPGASPALERYLPSRDEWPPASQVGAPPCTYGGTAVWTGTELIVWGGNETGGASPRPTNLGAAYNPTSDVWRPITTAGAPAGRAFHSAVWSGSAMIIWGGETAESGSVHVFANGGSYDPVLNRWEPVGSSGALGTTRHLAVWAPAAAGRPGLMLDWGGSIESIDAGTHLLGEGNVYDPALRTWYPMSMPGEPWPRIDATVVWTGTEMIVWGGLRSLAMNGTTGRDGSRYTP
jgi:hypothetical protein